LTKFEGHFFEPVNFCNEEPVDVCDKERVVVAALFGVSFFADGTRE